MPSKFAIPNQVAKALSAVKIPVTTKKAAARPPTKQVTVPTSTVPPAQTTTGIQPSVGTEASAKTDIPAEGLPIVPTRYPLIAVPPIPGITANVATVPAPQGTVPTSGVIVPTTPNGINPSVGGSGGFTSEFTALSFA